MKRILLIISVFIPFLAFAASPGKTVPRTRIAAVLSECRNYEGIELIRLGRFKTAALKGIAHIAAIDNPDVRSALDLMRGIYSLSVLDYGDCAGADKERINRALERALHGGEMLMEARDGDDKMSIYGLLDSQTDQVRDFVLYSPSECALICIFGSISLETVAKISSHDRFLLP